MEQPNFWMVLQGVFWLVAIFVGLRWLVLWYLKINRLVALQIETNALLRSINAHLGGEPVATPEKKPSLIPASVRAARERFFGRGKEFPW